MNRCLFNYSESIILSLCKEIEYIKNRSRNIKSSIATCQNKSLSNRLRLELNKLDNRRLIIKSISENMFKRNTQDLSYEFFFELSKRSNSFQQI